MSPKIGGSSGAIQPQKVNDFKKSLFLFRSIFPLLSPDAYQVIYRTICTQRRSLFEIQTLTIFFIGINRHYIGKHWVVVDALAQIFFTSKKNFWEWQSVCSFGTEETYKSFPLKSVF